MKVLCLPSDLSPAPAPRALILAYFHQLANVPRVVSDIEILEIWG